MTRCQRTNVGYAVPLARWLARHGADLLVDDRLPDTIRYQLVPAGAPIDQARAPEPLTPEQLAARGAPLPWPYEDRTWDELYRADAEGEVVG